METLEEDAFSIATVVGWSAAAAMMFGGVVPYIPQYHQIKQTENADGFSLFVCLALLVANTLRILFWFGHRFEMPLLIQSIVMNVTMILLVQLCVRVKNKSQIVRNKDRHFFASKSDTDVLPQTPSDLSPRFHPTPHSFWDFDLQYFWAWTDFFSYLEFMTTFTASLGFAIYLFVDNYWFVETIGFLAVFVEAMLGAPQFYKNYEAQSTEGMNKNMVLMWLSGDIFKTGYFIARDSPVQFWLCGTLQVCIDIAILLQVVFYRKRPSSKTKPSTYLS